MNKQTFLNLFGHITDAPGGIDKLRRLILDLAMQGRLTKRQDGDEPASELLKRVAIERGSVVKAGRGRKPKTLQPVHASDVPFAAPPGWEWTRIGTIFGMQAGSNIPAGTIKRSGRYPCYGGNGIRGFVETFNREGSYPIVGRQGALCGNVKVAQGKFYATEHAVVVECFAETSTAWAAIALEALNLNQYATATAQPGLSVERISSVLILVPPAAEQRRIVERVEELTALCDELEVRQAARTEARSTLTAATLHRVSEADQPDDLRAAVEVFVDNIGLHLTPGEGDFAALKRVRQAILDLAVRGRLTHRDPNDVHVAELLERIAAERDRLVKAKEIRKQRLPAPIDADEPKFDLPEGWEWSGLGQLILFSDSGWSPACLPSLRSDQSEWAVLKVSAVSWGTFRSDEHKLLTPGLAPRPQIEVRDGDFLMSRANTAELVGRSVVAVDPPPRLMLSDKHVRLRFLDRVTAEFVNLVNGSTRAREYYGSVATGTSDSMRNITRDQILALPIPVPPIEEQRRIVDVVVRLTSRCDELEQQFLAAKDLRRGLGASVAAHATSVDEGDSAA
ncbi:restriction endonuclease subunit S [Rhodococcus zopfii]|uniref:restriction endonuclease subunit S n=1 Tax=Rhodococcus zopfii TaxID=43772 RepID=UPI001110FF56|nr:restriction endonuclease subunit S [Rhodococcus zopfii]